MAGVSCRWVCDNVDRMVIRLDVHRFVIGGWNGYKMGVQGL